MKHKKLTIQLSPRQHALIEQAVEKGNWSSAKAFIKNAAIARAQQQDSSKPKVTKTTIRILE